ncbi:hypothetical protein TCAL_14211 [Tigriopus californicus]|uniref:Uncharacterized protein n=1 Tax=Tigriopus californicus TaxID=6832 RepID=A0A553NU61_TIGCA|nr:hypothetical protein TCAL_14211 [Tigriopus californicus]
MKYFTKLTVLIVFCGIGVALTEPINLGTAIVVGLGLKKAALIGDALSNRRRKNNFGNRRRFNGYKSKRRRNVRSVEEPSFVTPDLPESAEEQIEKLLLKASIEDVFDCDKKFVCEVSTKPLEAMDFTERAIYDLFGHRGTNLDVKDTSVEFQLAHAVGHLAGYEQCEMIYARCNLPYADILSSMERRFERQGSTEEESVNGL